MARSTGGAAIFQAGHYEELFGLIQTAGVCAVQGTPPPADWYIHVERSRDSFAALGEVRTRSDAERAEISKGTVVLDGQTQTLNADFVAQTLLLADALAVSEKYAASLLQEGIAESARWARLPTDVACLLYYREKLALLACVKELALHVYTLGASDDADALRIGVRMGRLLDGVIGADPAAFVARVLAALAALAAERARVQTTLQAPPGGARLSDEIQLERIAWVVQEEQELGHIVYMLALTRRLPPRALEALAAHLAGVQADDVSAPPLYLLTALLAALDTTPDAAAARLAAHASAQLYTHEQLAGDDAFLRAFHVRVVREEWACEGMRLVVALRWSLFLLEAMQYSAALAPQLGVSLDSVHALAAAALAGGPGGGRGGEADGDETGAQGELARKGEGRGEADAANTSALMYLLLRVLAFRQPLSDALNTHSGTSVTLDAGFQEYVLQQALHLVLGVTTTLLPLLRKLQRAEEDAAFVSLRTARPGAVAPARRYDIEALFDLIALICAGRAEAGLAFWVARDHRMSRFLVWAVDTREPGQQRALLHMLAALAAGEQCAGHAHALLESDGGGERRLFTWARLFEWMGHYVEMYQHTGGPDAVMPPDEMVLLLTFVRLLAAVVRSSAAARDSLYLNSQYAPIASLFALYACPVPVDLKAGLLDALTAFAPRTPSAGVCARIAAELWQRLEQSGTVVSFRASGERAPLGPAVYDLESVEAAHYRYPGTTALVRFLEHVLPSMGTGAAADALVAQARRRAAPRALPAPPAAHAPCAPYVAFVVDDVFLKASSRVYAEPAERWAVSAVCLDFIDHCLATFPVDMLRDTGAETLRDMGAETLRALVRHPGFDLLHRLLGATPLLRELFFFLHPDANSAGFEAVNADSAHAAGFTHTVCVTLRILLRVFHLQHVFLHVLLPALIEAGGALAGAAGAAASYVPLDMTLLHAHAVVVQMALYVNCTHEPVAYLAVRLLAAVARSATFQAADHFGPLRHRQAMNRLVGVLEMSDEAARVRAGYVAWLGSDTGVRDAAALADDDTNGANGAALADDVVHVPTAILDLLLANTAPGCAAPNVAHLLLGYNRHAVHEEDLLVDADAPARAGALLALLVRLLQGTGRAPLLEHAPRLAEKGFALLCNLCTHSYTSAATLRYLRTHHDVVVRQLGTVPLRPARVADAPAAVQYAAGSPTAPPLPTSAGALLALLRTQAHILTLTALELHTLTLHGQLPRAAPLIDALLGTGTARTGRLLALLQALEFQWLDERDAVADTITITTPAALAPACVDQADRVYDVRAVAVLLLGQPRAGDAAAWLEQASAVVQWAAVQNTRRAIAHARRGALQAWCRVLDVVLTEAFVLVPREMRAPLLLDTLAATLPRLAHGDVAEDALVMDVAAGAVLSVMHALRTLGTAHSGAALPGDRLLSLGRLLLDAAVRTESSAPMRGDLYGALMAFLDVASRDRGALEARVGALLHAQAARLVDVVARDALDCADVWKTVALAMLVHLAAYGGGGRDARRVPLAELLAQRGYLRSLTQQLLDLDAALQEALQPDPASLNAQYVYEAQCALFCRLVQTRAGAQQLLDARLLDVFARVDFPSLRPDVPAQGVRDADGFLPPAAERYDALLAPLLQLLAAFASQAPVTDAVAKQLAAVLLAHQDALLAVLRAPTHAEPSIGALDLAALLLVVLAGVRGVAADALAGFRTAALGIAAAYLVGSAAHLHVTPVSAVEREDAATLAPTYGGLVHLSGDTDTRSTLFDVAARRAVGRLVGALTQYLERASENALRAQRALLVPSLHVPPGIDVLGTAQAASRAAAARTHRVSAAAPSLGLAVAALRDELQTLTAAVQSAERVHAVLADPGAVRMDEWVDIARDADADVAPDAVRSDGTRALHACLQQLQSDMEATLDVVERLLVLLARHLDLFLAGARREGMLEPAALRREITPMLEPVLEKVGYLFLV
ncbi:hypothetical protein MSPP1_002254 [Malassezia sp. CBS 17886]|nr:hypothetical protein MSPP1_002254 [Malassezia sp. CBS 17886]